MPSRRGRTLVDAADHNHRVVLEALRRNGPLTRLDLAVLTALTSAGVSNILRRLVGAGFVAEHESPVRAGGRATRFGIVPGSALGIGLHAGASRIASEVIDLAGAVRIASEHPVGDPSSLRTLMGRLVEHAVVGLGPREASRLCGIGLADDRADAAQPGTLGALPLATERETVAAALAERQFGPLRADASFVSILLDDDVRAGLVIRGTVFDGVGRQAGRIGLMRTGEDGRPLREVASGTALAAAHEAHARGTSDAGNGATWDGATWDGATWDGATWDGATWDGPTWLDGPVTHLMDAIVAVSGLLAPADIVIGGRLPDAVLDALVAKLRIERDRRMIAPIGPKWLPDLRGSTLPAGGVLRGAALLPFFQAVLPDPRPARGAVSTTSPAEVRR